MSRLATVAAIVALSGCATQAEPPAEWVRNTKSLSGASLSQAMRIVADAAPIDTSAFEISANERARLEQERGASTSVANRHPDLKYCNGPLCLILLPVIIPALIIDQVVYENSVATFQPKLMPAEESARLAALFREQATGAAIASRLVSSSTDEHAPQLVVRIKSAEYGSFARDEFSITLTAEAQLRSAAGDDSPRTTHYVMLKRRPLDAWSDRDYGNARREIDRALDLLATSIGATYQPGTILPPKERVEHWGN
jgi:hypothetical protein